MQQSSKHLFLSFVCLFLFNCTLLFGESVQLLSHQWLSLEECLLPEDHPLQNQLKNLFYNSDMFKSRKDLNQTGFRPIHRMHRGLMVASHPTIKNYLFKKFHDQVPQRDQLNNFLARVNGARALHDFIRSNHLQHIIVPQKWIYPLPKHFNDPVSKETSYILIVEKMDIYKGGKDPNGELAKQYYTIDLDILKELCFVVYHIRGLDSMLDNMPLTRMNKIAFIDTEKWALPRRKPFLHQAMLYLREDRQQHALQIFQKLKEEDSRN